MVKFLLNEEAIALPGCGGEIYCPLEKLKAHYRHLLGKKCDMCKICDLCPSEVQQLRQKLKTLEAQQCSKHTSETDSWLIVMSCALAAGFLGMTVAAGMLYSKLNPQAPCCAWFCNGEPPTQPVAAEGATASEVELLRRSGAAPPVYGTP